MFKIVLTKRRKFVISSLILTIGLALLHFGLFSNRFLTIGILSLLTIPLTLWSLKEALKGSVWFLSWVLPMLFTAGVCFFYFLLPTSLFTAIPVLVFYLLGIYALFLSENIFSVAAFRTIQLLRSSMAVNFLLSLVTSFLIFDTVLSFRLPFYFNGILLAFISFLIFLHGCWVVNLEEKISAKLILYSFIMSLGIGEISIALSFWPLSVTLGSVFLASLVYAFLGLSQAKLSEKLFKNTLREYLIVAACVFLVLILNTNWS